MSASAQPTPLEMRIEDALKKCVTRTDLLGVARNFCSDVVAADDEIRARIDQQFDDAFAAMEVTS